LSTVSLSGYFFFSPPSFLMRLRRSFGFFFQFRLLFFFELAVSPSVSSLYCADVYGSTSRFFSFGGVFTYKTVNSHSAGRMTPPIPLFPPSPLFLLPNGLACGVAFFFEPSPFPPFRNRDFFFYTREISFFFFFVVIKQICMGSS